LHCHPAGQKPTGYPYFDYLRKAEPEKWKAIEEQAFAKEQQYIQTLQLPSLRKEINLMTLYDQKLRHQRVQSNNDSLLEIINRQINQSDLNNLNRAKDIIKQYGWLKISEIGKDGQNNLWLIVQHADQDVLFQQTALLAMAKLKGTQEMSMENYAFLYDRVQCNLNYKQLSSNGEASAFRPLKKEHLADERREKRITTVTDICTYLRVYLLRNNCKQSEQKDSSYQDQVRLLMDSAKYFYAKNEFQKTYDYYNTASTFLGGMSNADNFEAAIIFSRIAVINNEEQYKSIALDFLDLLYSRGNLTKAQLLKQPAFRILYKEQRWIGMNKRLN
jgi:hypothetical protein